MVLDIYLLPLIRSLVRMPIALVHSIERVIEGFSSVAGREEVIKLFLPGLITFSMAAVNRVTLSKEDIFSPQLYYDCQYMSSYPGDESFERIRLILTPTVRHERPLRISRYIICASRPQNCHFSSPKTSWTEQTGAAQVRSLQR